MTKFSGGVTGGRACVVHVEQRAYKESNKSKSESDFADYLSGIREKHTVSLESSRSKSDCKCPETIFRRRSDTVRGVPGQVPGR